eukprot:CAMPEP_0196696288 /NCGR_PEP_ID=MMETSP1090-20130531/38995_1 /TAXON_ID=37098 /ORGANISM="Isochrysis sp, Strain CCMP1244" /LENGTH=80 /DNA_ID=CAMNT_0042035877 /DNA_START=29 /DNA_END=268 /DNA_ORIENTATION=+
MVLATTYVVGVPQPQLPNGSIAGGTPRNCLAVHLAAASGAGPKGLDLASKCGAAGRAERRQAAATWRSGQASASPAAADD